MGMLQRGDGLDLAQEPLGANDGGQLGPEDLDGDPAVVLQVLREIDRGHPALAQLALDRVASREGAGQTALSIGQQQRTPFPLDSKNAATNSRSVIRGGCPAVRQCSRYAS